MLCAEALNPTMLMSMVRRNVMFNFFIVLSLLIFCFGIDTKKRGQFTSSTLSDGIGDNLMPHITSKSPRQN